MTRPGLFGATFAGSRGGTLGWFAAHEMRLSWRDWLSMMTAGRSDRNRTAYVVIAAFAALLHLLAYAVLKEPLAHVQTQQGQTMIVVSATIALSFFMMMSQALESVTRAFYGRSDMELILSSPARTSHVFAIRIIAVAISTALTSTLLAAPFIHMAAAMDGPHWLAAFAVVFAAAAAATSVSVIITVALFAVIGPRRTRLAAQIIAAIVGAGFIIGLQIMAIFMSNSLSRYDVLGSSKIMALVPGVDSLIWWPAHAAMGGITPLITLTLISAAMLAIAIISCADRFAGLVVATAGVSDQHGARSRDRARQIRTRTPHQVLRQKEWRLLSRDPWLVSQTLMQILYLLPPAVMLWQSYGDTAGVIVVLAPVLVMALGQLAGGLAWLAISGEDAPDLVATAPVAGSIITRAKIEAVLIVIMTAAAPFIVAILVMAPLAALIVCTGIAAASGQAVLIQLWFRGTVSRSNFRRRQTASKSSTFCEAFSSVAWAGATGLAVAASWYCLIFIVFAASVFVLARYLSQ